MKALFRIPLGRGKYLAVFRDMVILEEYDTSGMMYGKKVW